MSLRVRRSAQAENDLADIVAYIASDSPAAALRVADTLAAKGALLAQFPEIGFRDSTRPELRVFRVGSYLIIYRPIPGGIEILRYIHGGRDRRGRLL